MSDNLQYLSEDIYLAFGHKFTLFIKLFYLSFLILLLQYLLLALCSFVAFLCHFLLSVNTEELQQGSKGHGVLGRGYDLSPEA